VLNLQRQTEPQYSELLKKDGNATTSEVISLRDGMQVIIRPVRPDDAPGLQALFNRLSPRSIYHRFLGFRKALPDQEAKRLAEVDYQAKMALVATYDKHGRENIIGVARYDALSSTEPSVAEASVVVEDHYQGRGLCTHLLKRLKVYAQTHDIRAFRALVHNDNTQIMRLIQYSGLPVERMTIEQGVWDIQVNLEIESED
jgi:acetyltransferase